MHRILVPDLVFMHGEMYEKHAVRVEDGLIAGIEPRDLALGSSDAEVVELDGCTVLPGLIDAHIHFGPEVEGHKYARIMESSEAKLIKAVVDARNLLETGFTSARDVGGHRAIHLRDAISAGEIPGPRLRCSGRILTSIGGLEDHRYIPTEWVNTISDLVEVCTGRDGVRASVRRQRRLGADLIKVFATGADCVQQFSDDELGEMVQESKRLGMRVAAHAYGGPAVSASVRAGCYTIEHGSWLDEADCHLMADADVVLLPDLAFTQQYITRGPEFGIPQALIQDEIKRLKDMSESAAMAHSLGVKIGVGSDYGLRAFARHGLINLEALYLLEKAGLSRKDVLLAATENAAKAMDLADSIGKIEVGYEADLIAVAGNPLESLRNLEHMRFILKQGVPVLDRRALGRTAV